MITVLHSRAFQDNYIWLITSRKSKSDGIPAAIVDPGDADPVFDAIKTHRLAPVAILCTHHHGDHVGGVADLLARYPVPVYGPARERIRTVTHPVGDGDQVDLPKLGLRFTVIEIPGHTSGHIAFYAEHLLFCGDTLFSAGCGRLFEGTAEQMHTSLSRLAALPEDTAVYCGHEYTQANLRFALTVEPDNQDALVYLEEVKRLRGRDLCTLPSSIGRERRVNPFLRASEPAVRKTAERRAGGALKRDTEVFAVLRRWKDDYSG